MGNRLIAAGSYLLAGIIAVTALAAVATAVECEPPLPVTAASQESESVCTATEAAASMAQKPEGRAP